MLIIIDETPLSKNRYINLHWSKRAKYKQRIAWIIFKQKELEKRLKPNVYAKLPYAKATITIDIFFKYKRRRDIQNYLGGGLIAWLDALVDLHFIKDDSEDCVGHPLIGFYCDRKFPRTEIRIEKQVECPKDFTNKVMNKIRKER